MFDLTPAEEARAQRLHRECIVIDSMGVVGAYSHGKLKLMHELLAKNLPAVDILDAIERMTSTELGELEPEWESARRESGQTAYSFTAGAWGEPMWSYDAALRDLAGWACRFDGVDSLIQVTKAADIERAKREGRLGAILNFQNTTHIGPDIGKLDFFYCLGIRIIQLTYNDQNLVGAGCTERVDPGLSRFGQRVVKRMNQLGILVDLSHCGPQTCADAIEMSEVPAIYSHSFCKAIHNHDRGKTDAQLEAIAGKGGYAGITTVPFFLTSDGNPTIEHFLDHVDHAVKVIGADKVGIGTDWGSELPDALQQRVTDETTAKLGFRPEHRVSFGATTGEYRDWRDLPNITRGLVQRGYSDDEIKGILGLNFLRIFRQVVG